MFNSWDSLLVRMYLWLFIRITFLILLCFLIMSNNVFCILYRTAIILIYLLLVLFDHACLNLSRDYLWLLYLFSLRLYILLLLTFLYIRFLIIIFLNLTWLHLYLCLILIIWILTTFSNIILSMLRDLLIINIFFTLRFESL